MTVLSVKPVSKKRTVTNDLDRIFDEFFNSNFPTSNRNGNNGRNRVNVRPSVNVIENGDAFKIEVAAPGLEKEDFQVDIDKDVLRIEVNKEFRAAEGETYKRREFGYFEFKRIFRLPETIDTAGIEANYRNGILLINLPKKEESKEKPARTIEIQ